MASHINVNMQNMLPPTLAYPNDLLEGLSRQMAVSHASRRLSRGSNGTGARPGNAMRVAKPNSASNSPRSALSRRTTVSTATVSTEAGLARRRQHSIEPVAMPAPATQVSDLVDPTKRSMSRPLSWHPSFFQQDQQYLSQQYALAQYPFPTSIQSHDLPDAYGQYSTCSPAPTAYSCNTSPSSFSPLALPISGLDASTYLNADGWSMPQPSPPNYVATQPGSLAEPFPTYHNYTTASTPLLVGVDWSSFASHAFSDNTPPTPDLVPESQLAQPDVSDEDEDEEGEILVGMGLYDEPERYADDAHLETSRCVMSSLMGDAMPLGKGLKLEEEWAPPPPSADDDDDEEDEEDDAENESDDD